MPVCLFGDIYIYIYTYIYIYIKREKIFCVYNNHWTKCQILYSTPIQT